MNRQDYDTVEGITAHVGTLEGLLAIAKARRHAGYILHEKLNDFIVHGRWRTDTCGNFGRIVELEPALEFAATVVPLEQASSVVKFRMSNTVSSDLPDVNDECPVCGKRWDIKNAHDTYWGGRGQPKPHHRACYKLFAAARDAKSFTKMFKDAGFDLFLLTPVENGYVGKVKADEPYVAPWFVVSTLVGEIIIGWRKRVISIKWPERFTNMDGPSYARDVIDTSKEIFADEDVTKGSNYIHAWSEEKATEYLRKIRDFLS